MVAPYDFVLLEIPALDRLIESDGEEVRMSGADGESCDLLDVPRERELQLSTRRVPDLDSTVRTPGAKPLVARIEGHRTDPA